MKTSYVFLADGFEDIEAITVIDVLRRAEMPVKTVSISSSLRVRSAHGVFVAADVLYDPSLFSECEWLILPGGMPGAQNLYEFAPLAGLLRRAAEEGEGRIAAICAAPAIVLGQLGLLQGKEATCYPGFEQYCHGARMKDVPVVSTPRMVLGNGPGNALNWAITIVHQTLGERVSRAVAGGMLVYPRTTEDVDYLFG